MSYKCKCGQEFSNLLDLSDHVVQQNPEWPKLTSQDHMRVYEEYDDEAEVRQDQQDQEEQPMP